MLTLTTVSLISLIIGYVVRQHGTQVVTGRVRAAFFFIGGLGVGGILGSIAGWCVRTAYSLTSHLTLILFGIAVPSLLTIGLVVNLWIEVMTEKSRSGADWKMTFAVSRQVDALVFLLPSVMLAAGGTWAHIIHQAQSGAISVGNGLYSIISQMGSGI